MDPSGRAGQIDTVRCLARAPRTAFHRTPLTKMRSKTADAAAKRLRPAFAAASVLLVLLLAVLAYALASSQHQQRQDINKRFEDRARVAAAVNESLFSLASTTVKPSDAKTFGGATVAQHPLQQRTAVQQQFYAAILSSSGKILAKAGNVPADVASHPTVKEALRAKSTVYSSLMKGPGGTTAIESATAFPTKYGVRLDVTSGRADALAQFMNSFLMKLPNVAAAKSYVIDGANKVIATPGQKTRAGTALPDAAVAKAAASGPGIGEGQGLRIERVVRRRSLLRVVADHRDAVANRPLGCEEQPLLDGR